MTYIVPENNIPFDPLVLQTQMKFVEDDGIEQVQSHSCPQEGTTKHGADDKPNGEYKWREHIQQALIDLLNTPG